MHSKFNPTCCCFHFIVQYPFALLIFHVIRKKFSHFHSSICATYVKSTAWYMIACQKLKKLRAAAIKIRKKFEWGWFFKSEIEIGMMHVWEFLSRGLSTYIRWTISFLKYKRGIMRKIFSHVALLIKIIAPNFAINQYQVEHVH